MIVGMDIGGTKTAVLVVDQDLTIRSRAVSKTDVSNPANLMDGIVQTINCALQDAAIGPQQLKAVGAGLPGRVQPQTGEIKMAVNLNLFSFPFGERLSSIFGVPVFVENDVRTAALGAYIVQPDHEKIDQLGYLSIGTGISAGLVLKGHIYRGHSGMAGEIGHVSFESEGAVCGCGAYGCLEAVASGPALARDWQLARQVPGRQEVSAKDVYDAADRGDETAVSVIERASRHLARAIQMLIMLYDVEKLVLGGGVTRAGASFFDPVLCALSDIKKESDLAAEMILQNKISLLPAESDAPTWGAVNLALQGLS